MFCRGGSRVSQEKILKNSVKPLIFWALKAAAKSGVFDEIILSTDDAEIADIGKGYGAQVPFVRPAYLAKDTSDQFITQTCI